MPMLSFSNPLRSTNYWQKSKNSSNCKKKLTITARQKLPNTLKPEPNRFWKLNQTRKLVAARNEGQLMAKPDHEGSEFDQVLLEAIDDALSVYGEETKSAIYVYLERALGIPKRKIPARIDEFSKGLEDLFGIGSKSVEILIIKNLHSKIGVVLEMKTSNPWVLR